MCGEMAPENLNFTPHKTVHQAANCYTDYLLQLLPSETSSPGPYHRHVGTDLMSDVTHSISSSPVQTEPLLVSTLCSFY